jgi:hypothetical protein
MPYRIRDTRWCDKHERKEQWLSVCIVCGDRWSVEEHQHGFHYLRGFIDVCQTEQRRMAAAWKRSNGTRVAT